MKNFTIYSLVIAIIILLGSCKKGDTGPAGANGTNGTNGTNGNANVQLFTFGSQTFSFTRDYTLNVSRGLVDSSLVLAYFNPSTEAETAWYPMPGLGAGGIYNARYFFYQSVASPSTYVLSVRLMLPDGSGPYTPSITFRKVKIVLAPASSITVVAGVKPDLNNYGSVKSFFSLGD